MPDSGVVLASQVFVGNHLWHVLMLAAWVPLFGLIVLRQRRQTLHSATTDDSSSLRLRAGHGGLRAVTDTVPPWHQCMALGSVCAALVHVAVMPDHFAQSAWYGSFFLLAAIGQLAFAVVLVTRPTRALMVAGVTACALIVTLWLISRFIGIPIGPDNGATEPVGVLDMLASAAEAFVVAFGVLALRTRLATSSWRWSSWSVPVRLAAPICVAGTVVASIVASRS